MMNSRRHFLFKIAASAAAPALFCNRVFAQTPPPVKLEESDPVATALGYKEDTAKVDAAKYPMHTAEQKCDGCALYTGAVGAASGPCSVFGGKIVTAGGWCVTFAKKPEPAK
ncbi:MAG: high-potential iron-sulfur protein [Gloeobacteraceae cyanobacterium ES-bin-144]|nr:high-potential iron-sulfur protein [Verrucomicrobiales bacterium]